MTNHALQISDAWARLMTKDQVDTASFARELMRIVATARHPLMIRAASSDSLTASLGDDEAPINDHAASAKLRLVCSVLKAEFAEGHSKIPGESSVAIVHSFEFGDRVEKLALRFVTEPDNLWLDLSVTFSGVAKHVYDLTPEDLERHADWVFPMDDTVEDETVVRPLEEGEEFPTDLMRIARARFTDQSGRTLLGYVHSYSGGPESREPFVWCDGRGISFWSGSTEPSLDDVRELQASGLRWPLTYSLDSNAPQPVSGELFGLYYLAGKEVRCVRLD